MYINFDVRSRFGAKFWVSEVCDGYALSFTVEMVIVVGVKFTCELYRYKKLVPNVILIL